MKKIPKGLVEMVSADNNSKLSIKWTLFRNLSVALTSIFNIFHCSLRLVNMTFCKMRGTFEGERGMLFGVANTVLTCPYVSRISLEETRDARRDSQGHSE